MSNIKLTINILAIEPTAEQMELIQQLHESGVGLGASTNASDTFSAATAEDPAPAVEPRFRTLDSQEIIKAGDEWILKAQYRHRGGKTREWRLVSSAIGDTPSQHSKSEFRRMVNG